MRRGATMKLVALVSALVALSSGAAAAAEPAVIAVIAGSNRSPGPGVENLRYADDDAIQNARALSLLGVTPILLVTPDAETRELGPAPAEGPATRAALVAALERAFAALAAAKRARRPTRFYFLFAGHGDTVEERPFL